MRYWFEGEHAQRWGLPAAAVFAHIQYWIERNGHETGRPCVTQAVWQMKAYLPFLSEKQIRASLKKLVEAGALTRERNGFDAVYTYCLKGENGVPKRETPDVPKGQLEVTKRDNCTYRNNKTEEKTEARAWERPTEEEVVEFLRDIGAGDLAHTLGPEFFNYYEANGWMVGSTPIAKWRPKARQWVSKERNRQSNARQKGFNPKGFTPDGLRDFIDNG